MFKPIRVTKAMKTMEKAKFKAQKITSKAHSEQFILTLGAEYYLSKLCSLTFHMLSTHIELRSKTRCPFSGEPPGPDSVLYVLLVLTSHV